MQMKNKLKKQKGVIAIYVAITTITFTILLSVLFSMAVSTRKNEIKTLLKIKDVYEQNISKKSTIYQTMLKKQQTKVTVTVESSQSFAGKTLQAVVTYDEPKKVNTTQCKYVYNTSANKIGTNASSYTGGAVTSGKTINLSTTSTGTYYLHVLTTFINGKSVELISNPISVISGTSTTYSTANTTSNEYYTFTAQATGKYKLQVWGAQGGYRSSSTYGGKGGYSIGTINLTKGDKLYVYVGGKGGNSSSSTGAVVTGGYNGGGYRYGYKGGGGATDIRLISGKWNDSASLLSRIIVAGGGGSDGAKNKKGMYGGGTSGGTSTENYTASKNYCGKGGTQTYSGYSKDYTVTSQAISGLNANDKSYYCGGFGFGGGGVHLSSGYGGAGGGGWYGGSGSVPDSSGDDDRGGGGGSGFIWTSSTASNVPSGYSVATKYYLTDALTSDGSQSFESTSGGTETGHSGNGYAKITPVETTGEKNIVTYE